LGELSRISNPQTVEGYASKLHTLQLGDFVAHSFEHAVQLAIFAFA
tara:strand:- start:44 stop:181 length:138 start_codon:yes stop_codon:yes gene_type:complete